ncbi:MAG: hypothetical protein H6833_10865 [Planctomycetes bacterium]|nr:hypothetical protein [Planctomycetota bacterium]
MRLNVLACVAALIAHDALGQQQCYSVNDDGTFNNGSALGWPVAKAAFKGTAPTNLLIVGAEVFTGESPGTMGVTLWSHDTGNDRPATQLGTPGTWSSRNANCWQGALFPQPIPLAAGQTFWLAWDTTMFCQASFGAGAANVDYCYSADGGNSWQQSAPGVPYQQACKYRLLCAGPTGTVTRYGQGKPGYNQLTPSVDVCSWPARGNRIDLLLENAAPRVPAVLLLGAQAMLPIGVGTLLATPDVQLPLTTSYIVSGGLVGYANVQLPIPLDPTLAGASAAFQWWILDTAANDSLAHSDGILVTIG